MTFPSASLRSVILTLAAVPAASSQSQHIPPMDTTSPSPSILPAEPVAGDGGGPSTHAGRRRGWTAPILAITALLAISAAVRLTRDRDPTGEKTTQSHVLGAGIARAIHQFYSDYSRLPRMTDFVIGEDQDTDTSAAAGLILVLSGREPPGTARQNTRNINYLESMPAASRSAPGHWTGGVVVEGGDVSLVDSWGHAFRVRLDANYNGEIDNPCPEEVRNNGPFLYGRCLVWSAGKDGWEWTWRNNTKSWP